MLKIQLNTFCFQVVAGLNAIQDFYFCFTSQMHLTNWDPVKVEKARN